MLYYTTACNKNAKEHLLNTIQNVVNVNKYKNVIDNNEIEELRLLGLYEKCYMWGATPGKSNTTRWGKMTTGDSILFYTDGNFMYCGKIAYKTHNKKLAQEIWGKDNNGYTWEYIFFIKDIQEIKINLEAFNDFFGYSKNFKPQGFSNIQKDILNELEKHYKSIDEIIAFLSDKNINLIREKLNKSIGTLGEKAIEESIADMCEEKFIEYIKTLNSEASLEEVEGLKKIRKYNKTLIDKLKERMKYRCQICGQTTIDDFGTHIVEAHHIEKFSLTKNNNPGNLIILCPNHHRLVHKCNANIDMKNRKVTYSNGKVENIVVI